MRPMFDHHTKDADGRMVVGSPKMGCYDCGTVNTKPAANNKAIYHHPGALCCEPACERQVQWRDEEIAALDREWKERKTALNARRAQDESPAFQQGIDQAQANEQERIRYRINELRRERSDALAAIDAFRQERERPNTLPYKEDE